MRSPMLPFWSESRKPSSIFDEMDRMLKEFGNFPAATTERFAPAVNMVETTEDFRFSLDLPGMNKEQIKVELDDRTLSISGERKFEKESSDKDKWHRFEKSYGFFQRVFTLPTSVNSKEIKATYQDGVLEVRVPKSLDAKSKRIEIA